MPVYFVVRKYMWYKDFHVKYFPFWIISNIEICFNQYTFLASSQSASSLVLVLRKYLMWLRTICLCKSVQWPEYFVHYIADLLESVHCCTYTLCLCCFHNILQVLYIKYSFCTCIMGIGLTVLTMNILAKLCSTGIIEKSRSFERHMTDNFCLKYGWSES